MIKVLTGYSDKGGSTIALSNLVNEFNARGYEAKMYGPQKYHLEKCKNAGMLDQTVFDNIQKDDIVICHFLRLNERPPAKKVILSCHEKWWFEVADVKKYIYLVKLTNPNIIIHL